MTNLLLLCLRTIALAGVLSFALPGGGFAQRAEVLPVGGAYLFSEGDMNGKSFLIEAPAAGNYYCLFWLQPADQGSDRFTAYRVRVNDAFIGNVTPEKEGWQSAAMEGVPTVMPCRNIFT